MRCPKCGGDAVPQAAYCHLCGHRLGASRSPDENQVLDGGGGPRAEEAASRQPMADAASNLVRDAGTEPEKELWRGGYSSKAMAGGWAICTAITVLLLAGGIYFRPKAPYWLLLLAAILLPWLYCLVLLFHRRMSVHYLLTTQRFVHESGIVRRVTDRIEVIDIDNITFEQGPLERLLGVGYPGFLQRPHPSATRVAGYRKCQGRLRTFRQRAAGRAASPRAAHRADSKPVALPIARPLAILFRPRFLSHSPHTNM